MKSENENKNKQFNVPLGYFESFEERLLIELKFQKLFPNNNDGFLVPEHLFAIILKQYYQVSRQLLLCYSFFSMW